ncbi:Mitochondrial distribution and morphology protein 31, mitochondrial precursor [Sporothrix epigloea]|uniref:Mitochondrial distribution and morphology protein 31, mitochondrial n=1 Tax=Sporothrix epigloea TaxID=1892477 RepID=A0ABP0D8G8_9PEZI
MPSSSASTHQLGRLFWASVRDSVDALAWQMPAATRRHVQRSSTGPSIARSIFSARSFTAAAAEVTAGRVDTTAMRRSYSFLTSRRLFSSSRPRCFGFLSSYDAIAANARFSPNHVRRSCTSGGLLFIGLGSPSTPPESTVAATCAAAADTTYSGSTNASKTNFSLLARQGWHQQCQYRQLHSKSKRLQCGSHLLSCVRQRQCERLPICATDARRYKSSKSILNNKPFSRHSPKPVHDDLKSRQEADLQRESPLSEGHRHAGSQRQSPPTPTSQPPNGEDGDSITSSMSKYLQSHLPKISHRPTKEELLAAANGFTQRTKVRLKWLTIRSMRPWNADEWGAFVSWFMLGHLVWFLVGTTTFVSLLILTINTVFAQEKLAKWVGDYLTQSAGVTVIFESAIVPKWKNGVITFRNVFVSRRPGQIESSVTKGSSTSAAALAAARHTHEHVIPGADNGDAHSPGAETYVDDGNYTQFDVTINSVDVTLSFYKWWNGKGPLKDVEVRGVRGVVDRTFVRWSEGPLDPFSFRHEHQPGDFEIERFKLEDLMVTVHQPNGFRPFSASIFSMELPQLRKQWLFYDFLCANHVSGSYDGSLFTIHPRQLQHSNIIPSVVDNSHHNINNPVMEPMSPESVLAWKKFSRLRIDSLKIDHLNRDDPGPFGWIYEGNVDIVADVMLPAEPDESIARAMIDLYDKMEEAVTSNRYIRILDGNYGSRARKDSEGVIEVDDAISNKRGHLRWEQFGEQATATPAVAAPAPQSPAPLTMTVTSSKGNSVPQPTPSESLPQYVVMDLRLHLNDVRAAVPFFPSTNTLGQTRAQSYVNAALIRPIVAYMNAKRTYIPISCRVVKHLSDFDGSWTTYDCGLMDDTSAEVYAAFAHDVEDQQSRVRRLKKVGFWTLSMLVHALLAGVAGDLM